MKERGIVCIIGKLCFLSVYNRMMFIRTLICSPSACFINVESLWFPILNHLGFVPCALM